MTKYTVNVFANREEWYHKGEKHRENGPAEIWRDGTKKWYYNGLLHNTNGPAIITNQGGEHYFLNGDPMTEEDWTKHTQTFEFTLDEIAEKLNNYVLRYYRCYKMYRH